ncbi:MAG: HRDC domain-containing protein [Terriglobia bacterium]
MQCKIFSVPLESGNAVDRERTLNEFLDKNNVKRVFASLATQPEGPTWSVLFFYEEGAPATQRAPAGSGVAQEQGAPLTGEQVRSIVALKKWRADAAALEGVPLYMVAQNRWLEDIVRMPARTMDDLQKVTGFSEWRVQKYGSKIIEIMSTANSAKRSWSGSSNFAGRA